MSKYIRSKDAIQKALYTTPDGQVMTRVPCRIQVPVRFADKGLGQVGVQTFVYGLFALILPDTMEYSVCNVCSMIEIMPARTTIVSIDEVEYHEFSFDAKSVVIKTTTVVRRDALIFNIIDELVFKGKVPWYVEYADLGHMFDTAKSHGNSNVGQNLEVIEFIASLITRPVSDRTKYLRTTAKSYGDAAPSKVDYVPLKSVFYSVNSTLNKLSGSYFGDGIASALVNPTDRVDTIETILRS